jgi:hypothetical protein
MGLASCGVFFAVFRVSALSVLGALFVLGLMAWKLSGAWRKTPMSMQQWMDYKRQILVTKVLAEEDKAQIPWADLDALRAARHKQRRTNRVASPVLLVAGIGLLFLGAHLYQKTAHFLASAVPARGVVVSMEVNDSGEDTTWSPVVEFDHQGRRYRFKDSVGSNPASYRRGDQARVLYDPSRPNDARIDRGHWNRTIPLLIAVFGAVLCIAGLAVLRTRS